MTNNIEHRSAAQRDFRLYLQGELVRRVRQNPGYSLRTFAKALETDPSTLAKILRSKRTVGKLLVHRLGDRLGLLPSEIAEFQNAQGLQRRRTREENIRGGSSSLDPCWQGVSVDVFQIIADWYHYAILEIIRLDSWRKDPRWIAKALSVPVAEINAAIERLQRVGILEITKDGHWIDRSEGRTTNISQPFFASAHRRMQKQILEGAARALDEVPLAFRDQTSMTMAIDTDRLAEAKEKIRQFRRELAQFLSRGDRRDHVYQLSLSLYPITQLSKKSAAFRSQVKTQSKTRRASHGT